ncbi:cytochrome c [Geobacter sp. DSM 9736]|uniref:cytochrome c n=1 Tax=Geobacter sp. DSM 9736 TaxID=1277350 RepID=UPI000B5146B7|nr:cytochrome c [Geobacter sp. DSM 9736]SNB45404.1 Cytochrome C' [Geobacter sp. DSM 9736]
MNRFHIYVTCLVGTLMFIQTGAYAHEGSVHEMSHAKDAAMEKLHRMMPVYMQAQAQIDQALTSGESATVVEEIGKIAATIPDLKNARPHKNLKRVSNFRKIASDFEGDVQKTAMLVNKGDLAGARDAFESAKMRCNQCHATFRD